MSRILIAGCGYVGAATADLFHERGWKVEGWTASAESASRLGTKLYPVRALDISKTEGISKNVEAFDVVVQSVSSRGGALDQYRRIYLDGARNLLERFPLAKHIFVSSTSVYGQREGELVDETSPANPAHEKGKVLRATEDAVLARRGIVARVAAIYGPGRSFLLRKFLAGEAVIDREDDRFINQAHRDDIVSALFFLANAGVDVGGEIFNVVDDEPILISEALQWLSQRLQRSIPIGKVVADRKRGATNKRVSNRKLHAHGWEPRFPNFRRGMVESVLSSFGVG